MTTNRPEYQAAYYQLRRQYDPPTTTDATGTVRRLRALQALGWSTAALAHHTTLTRGQIAQLVKHQHRARVYVATARAVTNLYDRLSMTPGPSQPVASRARLKQWAPPLAWDDHDLDDPTAHPHVDHTRSRSRVHVDDVEWLITTGQTRTAIAHRLGVTENAIDRALHRADRADLVARLTRLERGAA